MVLEGGCWDQAGIALLHSLLFWDAMSSRYVSLSFALMQDNVFQSVSCIGQVLSSRMKSERQQLKHEKEIEEKSLILFSNPVILSVMVCIGAFEEFATECLYACGCT